MKHLEIIDFHTHAFPDHIAAHALSSLEKQGNITAFTDGTCSGLTASMSRAGIARSVICSIATRVEHFKPILEWSKQIRSNTLIPLPSVHPLDPQLDNHIRNIKEQGFVGIKVHPYYQDFFLAERRMDSLYRAVIEHDLLLVTHTGFDIAYPRTRRCDPDQVRAVLKKFPDLKLITTHLGGWDDWQEVERLLIGRPVYMEISFALEFLSPARMRQMLTAHPAEYLLFGTDSPWQDQTACLRKLEFLNLSKTLMDKMLHSNGTKLLLNSRCQ